MRKHNPIYKRALMLAVPMMIQNGITNMVSLVDNIMVGSQGTEAMTARFHCPGQLIFVFNLAIFGALAGPGIYGAQYYGQRNMHGFQSTFRIKLWLSLTCLIGGLLVFLLRDESLIGLYLHGESATVDSALTMTYAKQYLHIMLLGAAVLCGDTGLCHQPAGNRQQRQAHGGRRGFSSRGHRTELPAHLRQLRHAQAGRSRSGHCHRAGTCHRNEHRHHLGTPLPEQARVPERHLPHTPAFPRNWRERYSARACPFSATNCSGLPVWLP